MKRQSILGQREARFSLNFLFVIFNTCLAIGSIGLPILALGSGLEIEKDFPIRSIGQLQVRNSRGDIQVQGWALDKIRVKLKRQLITENIKSSVPLDAIGLRYIANDSTIEISPQFMNESSIQNRLIYQDHPQVKADLTIFAPSNLKLQLWTSSGKILLKAWNAESEIRSNQGFIRVEGVKADSLSVACLSCAIQLRNLKSSVRCLGGSGSLELSQIHGKSIYAETDSGSVKLSHVNGDQMYLSKSGKVEGQFLRGRVEFSSQQGNVELRDISGFVSGSTELGNITAEVKEWNPLDKAFLESQTGNIVLELPKHYSGDADIWSLHGVADVKLPLDDSQDSAMFGPEPPNHLVGKVREGGELFQIFTDTGDIKVWSSDR